MPFFQMSAQKWWWKDGKFLKIVEAKLFDKTGVIKLTIFNDILNSIVEHWDTFELGNMITKGIWKPLKEQRIQ